MHGCARRIERPGSGDFARHYDSRARGLSSHFVWTNRNKQSLTLDLKQPPALALLKRLVLEQADVLVQNLAPGAAAVPYFLRVRQVDQGKAWLSPWFVTRG